MKDLDKQRLWALTALNCGPLRQRIVRLGEDVFKAPEVIVALIYSAIVETLADIDKPELPLAFDDPASHPAVLRILAQRLDDHEGRLNTLENPRVEVRGPDGKVLGTVPKRAADWALSRQTPSPDGGSPDTGEDDV